jgi:hypothetical protein
MSVSEAWIQTYSGLRFNILAPQQNQITIEDIAHALSMQCRFTGHTMFHYSVAQHSVLASTVVPPRFAFEALLHDASEAFIGDMSRPLKHFTKAGQEYLLIEANIEQAIQKKFNLPASMSAEVKAADNAMLYTEKAALLPSMEWGTRWGDSIEPAQVKIEPWNPFEAEKKFLYRYQELRGDIDVIKY